MWHVLWYTLPVLMVWSVLFPSCSRFLHSCHQLCFWTHLQEETGESGDSNTIMRLCVKHEQNQSGELMWCSVWFFNPDVINSSASDCFSCLCLDRTDHVQVIPSPTAIGDLMDPLPVVQVETKDDDDVDDDDYLGVLMSICLDQGRSRPIRVLNRLTIVMSDSSHFVSVTGFFHQTCFIDTFNNQCLTVLVCSEK